MKHPRSFLFAIVSALALGSSAFATAPIYFVSTDITGAQTQIDIDH